MRCCTRVSVWGLVIFAAGCLWIAPLPAAEPEKRITVGQEAQVQGDTILLGDIATIEGSLEDIQKWGAAHVGRSPLAGKERRLSREQIFAAMRQQGIDVKKISIECPREVKIQTVCREFSVHDLEAITHSFILANMPWDTTAVKVEDFSAKPVQLPTGTVTWRVAVQPGEDYMGKFNADIIFSVNGSEMQRARVSAVIRVMVPVAVSAKTIERHVSVAGADIGMETKDLSLLPKGIVTDPRALEGKRAKISIAAGTLLRQEMFESDTAVRKGDIVTLAVNSPLFTITVPGEALDGGNPGDIIPVANMNSRNKVYGQVKNNKEVEVRY